MPLPYTPLAVANAFVECFGPRQGIEHMKLQKLVYCAHGWWLTSNAAAPLVAEPPQVWKFGPVFPTLYHALKPFGRDPIRHPQSIGPFVAPDRVDGGDQTVAQLLRWIWNRYGHLSSFALSEMTHKPNTAWYRSAKEHDFLVPEGLDIPNQYIAEEFRGILESESGRKAG